jgi:hypothetical protein
MCQHRPSRLVSKAWAPRIKGSHLISPYKQVTEAKSKLTSHTAACDFIGYFIFPVLCDLHVSIFEFYLCALPFPPPVPLSEHQSIYFFSGLTFLATSSLYYTFIMSAHLFSQCLETKASLWTEDFFHHCLYFMVIH